MRQEQLQEEINRLLTVKDLMEIFGRTRNTIINWRNQEGLDQCEIIIPGPERDNVRFTYKGVMKWAKENGKKTPGLVLWKRYNHERIS